MAEVTKKRLEGIPTIDVALVVLRTFQDEGNTTEYAIDTATSVGVEPQIEETDAIRLIKDGRLLAQKPAKSTITGNQITLTDNVFIPEVAKIIQGGEVSQTEESLPKYTPPASGSGETGEIFELDMYSAVYNTAGIITQYEKITYPNCQGQPFALSTEDDTFRAPEIVIDSMPATGEAPFTIEYVKALPVFPAAKAMNVNMMLTQRAVTSVPTANAEDETTALKKK